MQIIFLLIIATAIAFGLRHLKRRHARKELFVTPLSDHQIRIIRESVPIVDRLPAHLRSALEGKVNAFLHQVDFQGCNGLEVTEEMELSIATQACLLVVGSEAWYDHLTTVMIYPSAFRSVHNRYDGYVVTQEEITRLGESWARGPVILSWAHTQRGAQNPDDGHNVAFHEFAHQLDGLSGYTDGAPVLNPSQSYGTWEQVMLDAYDRHVARVEEGRETVLDAYGAKAHEEFFAVAVEVFLEKPLALSKDEPELYAQLSKLFQIDPKNWN